jgi:hypothetical protein
MVRFYSLIAGYYILMSISRVTAAIFYRRLTTRLAFVPLLEEPIKTDANPTDSDPAEPETYPRLLSAYQQMEYVQQITISAAAQLRSIYYEATSRLNQLMLGQNMFRHDPDWVPRLSYKFHNEYIEKHTKQLKDLEKAQVTYEEAFADQNKAIKRGIKSADEGKDQAQARIDYLTGPNGPILMHAWQIGLFTPVMKEKKKLIKESIAKVQDDIQNKINLDPQALIDGLSALAFAPANFAAFTQGLNIVYKAATEVQSADGVNVKKEYVISELGSAGQP